MEEKEIQIVESFKVLTKNIVNLFETKLFKKNNISCSELSALKAISECNKENKQINVTELANLLKITKSAASQLISKLEKKEYVKRKINLFDKKVSYISLTDDAIKKHENTSDEYNLIIHKGVEKMGEIDIRELSRLLEKLSNIICELGKVDEVC